jgi:tetratricopeptide (TPR) repeat protein
MKLLKDKINLILIVTAVGILLILVGREKLTNQVSVLNPTPSLTATPDISGVPSVTDSPMPSASLPPIIKPVAYKGRDPMEVRPLPEEVKLFTEEQRQQIYNSIGNYGQEVKDNPDNFNSWIRLGVLKKNIGDFEGARDAWEYASVIRPQNSLSYFNLGFLYWRYLKEFALSEKNFKISIQNKSDDASTYVGLSQLYFYSYESKKDQADDVLNQGLIANPDSGDLMRELAAYYERIKDYPKSLEWWKKLQAKYPDDKAIAEKIKELEAK